MESTETLSYDSSDCSARSSTVFEYEDTSESFEFSRCLSPTSSIRGCYTTSPRTSMYDPELGQGMPPIGDVGFLPSSFPSKSPTRSTFEDDATLKKYRRAAAISSSSRSISGLSFTTTSTRVLRMQRRVNHEIDFGFCPIGREKSEKEKKRWSGKLKKTVSTFFSHKKQTSGVFARASPGPCPEVNAEPIPNTPVASSIRKAQRVTESSKEFIHHSHTRSTSSSIFRGITKRRASGVSTKAPPVSFTPTSADIARAHKVRHSRSFAGFTSPNLDIIDDDDDLELDEATLEGLTTNYSILKEFVPTFHAI
ncbi:hypothetical protein C8J56DRAFT_886076 [Mycena floridula]|nr:hypothetical protein C8J56DRAFT_886076 [Mycena floridula]